MVHARQQRECGTLDLDSSLTRHCFPEGGGDHSTCCVDINLPKRELDMVLTCIRTHALPNTTLTHTHTHTHTHARTKRLSDSQHTHTHTHTHTHMYSHSQTHKLIMKTYLTRARAARICTNKNMHTRTHSHTHKRTHMSPRDMAQGDTSGCECTYRFTMQKASPLSWLCLGKSAASIMLAD
jgi:hypothetical protein